MRAINALVGFVSRVPARVEIKLLTAFLALLQLSVQTRVSGVLIVGLLALAAIALPAMIVLWRWSRS